MTRFKWEVSDDYPAGHLVPFTDEEEAQADADQAAWEADAAESKAEDANAATIQSALVSHFQDALALADAIDAGTATPTQQRQALSLCLHGLVRLSRVVYRMYEQSA